MPSQVPPTSPKLVYDLESQTASSPSLQRTLSAIGDRTALIVNDKRNKTTLTSEPLRVEYELVSTTNWWKLRTFTLITRRNTKEEAQDVLLAEWEINTFGTDRLRLSSSDSPKEYFPAKTYLKRDGLFKQYLTFNHRFEVGGRGYIWRSRLFSKRGAITLYAEGNDEAMATTVDRRFFIKPRLGFIEISRDEDILDELVVTWAIVRQRGYERAALFNLIHVLLIDCLMFTLLEIYVWS